jgi:hypothetical protein
MMIQSLYTYSWFANLAYVNWRDEAVGLSADPNVAIQDANAQGVERVPGDVSDPNVITLGERIFIGEG